MAFGSGKLLTFQNSQILGVTSRAPLSTILVSLGTNAVHSIIQG
jgi:hypothetical protein